MHSIDESQKPAGLDSKPQKIPDKETEAAEELAPLSANAGTAVKASEAPKSSASGRGRGTINFALPIWKSMLVFLIPLMLSNTLQSIGGTVSSVLLGRAVGEGALASASAVFPVTFFLVSFVIGLGSASSVLIGQAYSSGQAERMKATVGTSLTFTLLLGLLAAAVGNLFCRELLLLIGTPPAIIDSSIGYARIIFTGLPIMFIYTNYTTFLRGTGDSKTPFYFLVISTALTIALSLVFVLGWLGLPSLGLNGAALATVLATLVTFLALIGYLWWIRHPLALDRETVKKLRLDRQIVSLLIKIGLPTSVQMIFVSMAEIAVIVFVNAYGAHATAAYGAVNQIVNYVQMPAMSLGIAAGIFGAQLIGAGKQDRLDELIKGAVVLNYVIGVILIGIVYLFNEHVLSWFLTEPSTAAMAKTLLNITLWAYLLFGNSMIISGMMRSSGTVLWPMLITIFSIWGVEVPAAYLLSRQIGIEGIWLAYPISFSFSLLAQYVYYRLFWKNKDHGRLFDPPPKTS